MLAGQDSSEAYLILKGLDLFGQQNPPIAPLAKVGFYNHQIQFDGTRSDEAPFVIKGWAFHSYRAINPSDQATDPDALYLVRFCDLRYFFNKQPCQIGVTGAAVESFREGFNIISMTVDDSAMSYDESTTTNFPYDTSTTAGPTTPYTWAVLLGELWRSSAFTDELGAVMGFTDQTLPSGGSYPDQGPIDVRPENRGTWEMFCDLLHCTGNEVFPNHDGTFRIQPIDDDYNTALVDSVLGHYLSDVIDQGNAYPDWHKLPLYATMTFLKRFSSHFTDGGASLRNINNYEISDPAKVYDASGIIDPSSITLSADVENGVIAVGEITPGSIEDFTTIGRSAVFGSASAESARVTNNANFMFTVLRRYYKARLGSPTDITFPYFINSAPQPQWNEVLFYLARNPEGAPDNRTHFLNNAPPSPGVKTLPMIPGGGSGSGGDRLVAADTTDDIPRELYGKTEDHDSYDDSIHQLVYTQVVSHGTDPTQDNTIRFFTIAGTPGSPGDPGSPGADGAAGADGDTVDEGYAIDVTHAGTVATVIFDPTELFNYSSTKFQLYAHRPSDPSATHDRWQTIESYTSNFDQFLWHPGLTVGADAFEFHTVGGYGSTHKQLFFQNAGTWQFKTADDYDESAGVKQLLGHNGTTWTWKTLPEWLQTIANWNADADQILGHLAGGDIEWKTLTDETIHNVTGNSLQIVDDGVTLKSSIPYTPIVVRSWLKSSDSPATYDGTVSIDRCTS